MRPCGGSQVRGGLRPGTSPEFLIWAVEDVAGCFEDIGAGAEESGGCAGDRVPPSVLDHYRMTFIPIYVTSMLG